jgi:hypothetical protein
MRAGNRTGNFPWRMCCAAISRCTPWYPQLSQRNSHSKTSARPVSNAARIDCTAHQCVCAAAGHLACQSGPSDWRGPRRYRTGSSRHPIYEVFRRNPRSKLVRSPVCGGVCFADRAQRGCGSGDPLQSLFVSMGLSSYPWVVTKASTSAKRPTSAWLLKQAEKKVHTSDANPFSCSASGWGSARSERPIKSAFAPFIRD